MKVKDFLWKPSMTVKELTDNFGSLGYQSIELNQAIKVILKMKQTNSKIFLTFTFLIHSHKLSAVFCHEKFSLLLSPLAINSFLKFSSLTILRIASAIESTENGSVSKAASPAISGI